MRRQATRRSSAWFAARSWVRSAAWSYAGYVFLCSLTALVLFLAAMSVMFAGY